MFKILSKLNKFSKKFNLGATSRAFTIVELLVVIVVIGILASITAVSYSGVAQKAKDASLKADLRNIATILELDKAASPTNSYPVNLGAANGGKGITMSSGNAFDYSYIPNSNAYTLIASKGGIAYQITSSDTTPMLVAAGGDELTPTSFALAWGGSDDEEGNSIISTSDGGFATTGGIYSSSTGYYDTFIAKYASDGGLVWSKTWGGSSDDEGNSIIQTSDGGYAVTGDTSSYGAGSLDMFISKYTSDGTLSWIKTWGGSADEIGNSIIQTSDGGYAIAGSSGMSVFIVKYMSDGALDWKGSWSDGAHSQVGNSIAQISDGSFVITGQTNGYGAGNYDMFITKYSSSGTYSWTKTWGGTSADYGYSITSTSDGGFAVTGHTMSYGAGSRDMFIVKYTSDGTLSWNKTWGGTSFDEGYSIIQASDGGFVVAGKTYSYGAGLYDMFITKYTSDGTLSWNKTWGSGGNEVITSVTQTDDAGYAITGYTSNYGAGGSDVFIAKYLSDGIMTNCSAPMCQSPSATVKVPSATVVVVPSVITSVPSATATSPLVTTAILSATTTVIVAP